jgi:hypothetical protein
MLLLIFGGAVTVGALFSIGTLTPDPSHSLPKSSVLNKRVNLVVN